MKTALLLAIISVSIVWQPKHIALPHGMIYGSKPATAGMSASQLETFMGKKTRISTSISGKVLKVIKTKGGWFNMDAGNGNIIEAHFKNYGVTLPEEIKGRTVIVTGVAAKEFIADDLQHMAGDTVSGKKQHTVKSNPKNHITFEVAGLMIDK